MGTQVLTNAKLWLGQFDVSGYCNSVKLAHQADSLEDTVFGASYHTHKPGLRSIGLHEEGFVQYGAGTIDDILFGGGGGTAQVGVSDVPVSVSPTGGAGNVAYFFKSLHTRADEGVSTIGDLLKFTVDAEASGKNVALVSGTILEDGTTSRTASGSSTPFQVGAVSSTQKIYGILHLLAASSLTGVTFTLQSAATSGGSYTTRATFATTFTGLNSEFLIPVAGPVTDTWWKLTWTLTGTSFTAVGIIGIE